MAARVTSSFLPSLKDTLSTPQVERPPRKQKQRDDDGNVSVEIPEWLLKLICCCVLIPAQALALPLCWLWESNRDRKEEYRKARERRLRKAEAT